MPKFDYPRAGSSRRIIRPACALTLAMLLAACGGGGGGGTPFFPLPGAGTQTPPAGGGGDGAGTAKMELRTLSTRADLVSGGDVLIEVLPEGGDATGLKVTLNGIDVTDGFGKRADGRITGVVTGLAIGANALKASTKQSREATLTVTNAPTRRARAVQHANDALRLRHAGADGGERVGSGHERQRPHDQRDGCAVQHRHGIQALLPDPDACFRGGRRRRLFLRVAGPEPQRAGRAAAHARQFVPAALCEGCDACRLRCGHDHDGRRDRALHRACGARHDQPRHLRHRRALRSCSRRLDRDRAASPVEPQGAVLLRCRHGLSPASIPLVAELGRRRGTVARLHGGRQQHDRLPAQREPLPQCRNHAHDEGAHHRHVRRSALPDGQRRIGAAPSTRTAWRRSFPA